MGKAVIFVNSIEFDHPSNIADVAQSLGRYDAAMAIAASCKKDKRRYNNLVNNVQLATSVTSLASISKPISRFVPIIDIPTNFLAGVLSVLKVVVDYDDEKGFTLENARELVVAMGNFSSIGMTVSALTGNMPGLILFSAVALFSTTTQILAKPIADGVMDCMRPVYDRYFSNNFSANYQGNVVAPDFSLANHDEINSVYGGRIAALGLDRSSRSIERSSLQMPNGWFDKSPQGVATGEDLICDDDDPPPPPEPQYEGGLGGPMDMNSFREWYWDYGRYGGMPEPEGRVIVGPPIDLGPEPDCSLSSNYGRAGC